MNGMKVPEQAQLSEVTRKEQREFLQKYQEAVAEARKAEKAGRDAQFRAAELNHEIRQLGGQINRLRVTAEDAESECYAKCIFPIDFFSAICYNKENAA